MRGAGRNKKHTLSHVTLAWFIASCNIHKLACLLIAHPSTARFRGQHGRRIVVIHASRMDDISMVRLREVSWKSRALPWWFRLTTHSAESAGTLIGRNSGVHEGRLFLQSHCEGGVHRTSDTTLGFESVASTFKAPESDQRYSQKLTVRCWENFQNPQLPSLFLFSGCLARQPCSFRTYSNFHRPLAPRAAAGGTQCRPLRRRFAWLRRRSSRPLTRCASKSSATAAAAPAGRRRQRASVRSRRRRRRRLSGRVRSRRPRRGGTMVGRRTSMIGLCMCCQLRHVIWFIRCPTYICISCHILDVSSGHLNFSSCGVKIVCRQGCCATYYSHLALEIRAVTSRRQRLCGVCCFFSLAGGREVAEAQARLGRRPGPDAVVPQHRLGLAVPSKHERHG